MRLLDKVYAGYAAIHIVGALMMDLTAIYPRQWTPLVMLAFRDQYVKSFGDPLMAHPPAFFQIFLCCEAFLQLPFLIYFISASLQGIVI